MGIDRRLGWMLRAFPAEYRGNHADEIATTLMDSQGGKGSWLGLLDMLSLLTAGLRIRARSFNSDESFQEIRIGVVLGVRLALFAQAVVATAFVWWSSVQGQSVWSQTGVYPAQERVLLAVLLGPWIVVFAVQLFGWWRTALGLAAVSDIAVLGLLYYKVAISPFGTGGGFTMAMFIALTASAVVALGMWLRAGRACCPWLGLISGLAVAGVYAAYVDGVIYNIYNPAPLMAGGLAFLLVAIGMAISGTSRGLIACAVLAFPATFVVTRAGGILFGGSLPSIITSAASFVAAVLLSIAAMAIAVGATRRPERSGVRDAR